MSKHTSPRDIQSNPTQGKASKKNSYLTFRPFGQLARFAAGCYIEMATLPPLAHEYELVSGRKRIFGEKRVIAGPFMNQSKKFQRVKSPKFRWRRSR